jgi:hypothetical protein
MDWLPAFLMNLILAGYMWNKVVHSIWKSVGLVFLFYVIAILSVFVVNSLIKSEFETVNIAYLFIGICVFLPFLIFLIRTKFYKWYLVGLTIFLLVLALIFRSLDYPTPLTFPEFLPQGTHFLWHITSAMAVFTLGYYFYYIKDVGSGGRR